MPGARQAIRASPALPARLLDHWRDPEARELPFYFCQIEAIETLVWWVEAPEAFKQGIFIPGDGGPWDRICNKMATGAGKTAVMGLIITWQVLNALTYPKRKEFSRAVFVVAPGLTVKERLQVLYPGMRKTFTTSSASAPIEALRQKLNQAALLVENWHTLMPLKEPERSVVKKGRGERRGIHPPVLGHAGYKDIVVINDEAHHAYRQRAEVKISKKQAEDLGIDLEEATRWIEGLDRIHKTRRIRRCFDLSATPFAPTGKKSPRSAVRLDRVRLRAQRRHRGGVGEDARAWWCATTPWPTRRRTAASSITYTTKRR